MEPTRKRPRTLGGGHPSASSSSVDNNTPNDKANCTGRVLLNTELPTARWSRVLADGSVEWDATKIKCFLSDDERRDELLLRNVLHGSIVSGHLYPLVFDGRRHEGEEGQEEEEEKEEEGARLRSLAFLRQVAADRSRYDALTPEQRLIVGVGLRDLYFAASQGLLPEDDVAVFKAVVDLVDDESEDAAACLEAQGMHMCFHPTRRFKVLRHVDWLSSSSSSSPPPSTLSSLPDVEGSHHQQKHDADDDDDEGGLMIDPKWIPYFARAGEPELGLCAVFVDPEELSYHNFECIVRLDRWFECRIGDMMPKGSTTNDPMMAGGSLRPSSFKGDHHGADHHQHVACQAESTKMEIVQQPRKDIGVFKFCLTDVVPLLDCLQQLDRLDLYTRPFNASTRGGKRFIFHSSMLSKVLGGIVRSSGLLARLDEVHHGACTTKPSPQKQGHENDMMNISKKKTKADPKTKSTHHSLTDSFAFVNYVFRMNKFAPSDAKFANHLDTPYYDAARSHVSKYTMLIYLTGGRGDPSALRVGDLSLCEIEPMTCVVFDQRYEHEGTAYLKGDKVFLRTELIFEDKSLSHSPVPASLFSTACYMTQQSVFQPELAAYAHQCYEKVNALHWGLASSSSSLKEERREANSDDPNPDGLYLWKRYNNQPFGIDFVTNGHDYWFPKRPPPGLLHPVVVKTGDNKQLPRNPYNNQAELKECAMVALLDYFNCKVNGLTPFRALCDTVTLRKEEGHTSTTTSGWVWSQLQQQQQQSSGSDRYRPARVFHLIQDGAELKAMAPDIFRARRYKAKESHCCPFHLCGLEGACFRPDHCDDVIACYRDGHRYSVTRLLSAPVLFLNQKLLLNESNVLIAEDNKIYVSHGGRKPPTPINFAACWNDPTTPPSYIGVAQSVYAPRFLLPPMLFHEYPEGYHLVLDFFRNDWMLRTDPQREVPVPKICDCAWGEESPFLDAVNPIHSSLSDDDDDDDDYSEGEDEEQKEEEVERKEEVDVEEEEQEDQDDQLCSSKYDTKNLHQEHCHQPAL